MHSVQSQCIDRYPIESAQAQPGGPVFAQPMRIPKHHHDGLGDRSQAWCMWWQLTQTIAPGLPQVFEEGPRRGYGAERKS